MSLTNEPLLQLTLIVKDAATCIEEMLDSYIGFIDAWCILDTGSTDNTTDVIKKWAAKTGIPGAIFEKSYPKGMINFQQMRNDAFVFGSKNNVCTWMIMPDDSYILNGGHHLIKILKQLRDEPINGSNNLARAVILRIKAPGQQYQSCRIARTSEFIAGRVYWKSRVHEVLHAERENIANISTEPIFLYDQITAHLLERSAARRRMDLEALLLDYADQPEDLRTWFYIGLTNQILADKDIPSKKERYLADSLEWFQRCTDIVGKPDTEKFNEYAFEAALQLLDVSKAPCDSLVVDPVFKLMRAVPPRSAEILHKLSLRYLNENVAANREIALMMGLYAERQEIPTQVSLFVNPDVYKKFVPFNLGLLGVQTGDLTLANRMMNKLDRSETALIEKLHLAIRAGERSKLPIIVFVTGMYYHSWNGSTRPLGGSEQMLVNYAEYIAATGNYNVFAFVHCEGSDQTEVNGVTYRSNTLFSEFVQKTTTIETVIVSRHSEFLNAVGVPSVKNVYMWLHDCVPIGNPTINKNNFRKFITLSKWHEQFIKTALNGISDDWITVCGNSISLADFPQKQPKIRHKMIYSSAVDRGLLLLAGIFPKIREAVPDATLTIFADLSGTKKLLSENAYAQLREFVKTAPGVTHFDFSDRRTLYIQFSTSEYWVYPNFTFSETFCITAIEAQYSGCIPLTTNVAALAEIVKNGVLLTSPQKCVEEIIAAIQMFDAKPKLLKDRAAAGRKFAAGFDISKMGPQFLKLVQN